MKLVVKEGDEGGRWAHNTLSPQKTQKLLSPGGGGWSLRGGVAGKSPILHLPLKRKGEVRVDILKPGEREKKQSQSVIVRREIREVTGQAGLRRKSLLI